MQLFTFAGHDLAPLPDHALWWPGRRALIVADLHLEKGGAYARAGAMLPPYDSLAAIERLESLVERTRARELWALGDSFHDRAGPAHLPPALAARLRALVSRVDWTWITGNHDAESPGALGGQVLAEAAVDGLILRHEAEPGESRPELSGHYHPKWRIGGRGRMVSRRCFVAGARRIILPAFGALAGGLHAGAPAIRALAGPQATALVPVERALLRFPIV